MTTPASAAPFREYEETQADLYIVSMAARAKAVQAISTTAQGRLALQPGTYSPYEARVLAEYLMRYAAEIEGDVL